MTKSWSLGLAALATLLVAAVPAAPGQAAAGDDNFFQGKSINLLIAYGVGGGYDIYARLIAQHMARHIPGQPTIVPRNMPGAAGNLAANHLYSVAPKDGTTIGMVSQAIYLGQILGDKLVKADATKFNWIGRLVDNSAVLISWHAAPVKTLNDVYTTPLLVSVGDPASRLNWALLNTIAGTKFQMISGYTGQNEGLLAMQRGEVHAVSQPWPVIKSQSANLLAEKKINLLLQTGMVHNPGLESLPRMVDLAKTDEDRKLVALFASPSEVGRAIVAPPDLPEARVIALRRAFDAALKDPEFLKDAEKRQLDLNPLSGEQLQTMMRDTNFPPELLKRARDIVTAAGGEEPEKKAN